MISDLSKSSALQLKTLTVKDSTPVRVLVGRKFSLKLWWSRATKEDFGIGNGYYPVYEFQALPVGVEFSRLDLAITDLRRRMIISAPWFGTKEIAFFIGDKVPSWIESE